MIKYKVGDKVKIVGEQTVGMNDCGGMDKYLGSTMTIGRPAGRFYKMVEDNGRWLWNDNMISGLVNDKVELHPDFAEWYGEIKDKWKKIGSHKQFAIYVINRMGFGGSLTNSNYQDIKKEYIELADEMQRNKEKYTRAILDDNWTVRKEQLYYVELPYVRNGRFLNQCTLTREIIISDSDECLDYKTKFTEKEIKAIDERYFAFAEPVEED